MLVCCYIVVYFQFTRNKYLKVLFSFLSVPLHCMCLSCNIFTTPSNLVSGRFQEMRKFEMYILAPTQDLLLSAPMTQQNPKSFGSGAQIFSHSPFKSTFGRFSAEKKPTKGGKVQGVQERLSIVIYNYNKLQNSNIFEEGM